MKKYRITILVRTIEEFEVEAESRAAAERIWPKGELVRVDQSLDNEILSVEEA